METCRICGEEKPKTQFHWIPCFSKWKKKHWCRDCQKLFLEMKKQKLREAQWSAAPFTVTFE